MNVWARIKSEIVFFVLFQRDLENQMSDLFVVVVIFIKFTCKPIHWAHFYGTLHM